MKEAKVSLAHGRTKRIVHLALILAFSYLLLFYNLGAYSLKEPDE
jgi:hypothetical protein